jgi:cytochrome oxidase Cu insertion factor (SCO1/SenC/PrrC family)
MRLVFRFVLALLAAALPAAALAQPKKSEEDFVKQKPAVGDALPELTVYSPDGKEVKTSSLRGQFVVLTFGCLT